jgi:putative alpha-1,2-mannosidase
MKAAFAWLAPTPIRQAYASNPKRLTPQPLDRCWRDHKEIVAGGVLELELGAEPNKAWGSGAP